MDAHAIDDDGRLGGIAPFFTLKINLVDCGVGQVYNQKGVGILIFGIDRRPAEHPKYNKIKDE